jgi:hypothetical protein
MSQKVGWEYSIEKIQGLSLNCGLGVWLSRNASLFGDRYILPLQCALQSKNILNSFLQFKDDKPIRYVEEENIDRSVAWIYFDGAAQRNPQICGAGGSVISLILIG